MTPVFMDSAIINVEITNHTTYTVDKVMTLMDANIHGFCCEVYMYAL